MSTNQAEIDARNAEFWNTLCGTLQARQLGVTDGSRASLKKFDDWYLGYYPYLLRHVPLEALRGKDVLEVGLGYGTLSQQIAMAGARYSGLDIASGPVSMVNSRLAMNGLPGQARQGSMLDCPFEDGSFDAVVSIGCFHHTGDMQRCLDETWRVLRPGGHAYLMVYNRFSYRQWRSFPLTTLSAWLRQAGGRLENAGGGSRSQRAAYDADEAGQAAPETQFFSAAQVHAMMARFREVGTIKENCEDVVIPGTSRVLCSRERLLGPLGRRLGLDLYIHAVK